MARLRDKYQEEVAAKLAEQFRYKSSMQIPKIKTARGIPLTDDILANTSCDNPVYRNLFPELIANPLWISIVARVMEHETVR